jgi:hypothetical protein
MVHTHAGHCTTLLGYVMFFHLFPTTVSTFLDSASYELTILKGRKDCICTEHAQAFLVMVPGTGQYNPYAHRRYSLGGLLSHVEMTPSPWEDRVGSIRIPGYATYGP